MKLLRLSIDNFGIFGGNFDFDLAPTSPDQFTRPIILFSGKNGVGKTTLVEAIRLCLHGSLALANRVSRSDYETYLKERIFKKNGSSAEAASLCLEFEYAGFGKTIQYGVTRTWKINRKKVLESVEILEGGLKPVWLKNDAKDLFLRELVPPSALEFFFLDGEHLDSLTNNISNPLVISNVIKSLFGLHLSEQLIFDLDIFISRQDSLNGQKDHIKQLQKLHRQTDRLNQQQTELSIQLQKVTTNIFEYEELVQEKEQEIAQFGGSFVQDFDGLRDKEKELTSEIELAKREIQELFGGLLPFAISPTMLKKVAARLTLEKGYRERRAAQKILKKQIRIIANTVDNDTIWEPLGGNFTKRQKEAFANEMQQLLSQALPGSKAIKKDILIHASDLDTETMLMWIDLATESIPLAFGNAIANYEKLINKLQAVEEDLERVPPEETTAPMYAQLHELRDKLSELGASKRELEEQLSRLEYEKETNFIAVRKVREAIQASEHLDERVQLASRTQELLEEYSTIMLDKKISLLEEEFVDRFNTLCRKSSFIDAIQIDRETFVVTLERSNHQFLHKELSAGETQIFAVAFVWALYNVAGLPIPMVFDTPLARLDTDHRQKMLISFLPKVSHQMLLLATDAEIDQAMIKDLTPALSHGYYLEFDETNHSTTMKRITID
jgi:DNA sulfur modification protein DndD